MSKPSLEELQALKRQKEKEREELERKEIEEREERLKEYERVSLAVSMKICPECGAEIIDEPVEKLDKPELRLFGLARRYTKHWYFRQVCSVDKKHYEKKEDYHRFDDYMC